MKCKNILCENYGKFGGWSNTHCNTLQRNIRDCIARKWFVKWDNWIKKYSNIQDEWNQFKDGK